MEEYLLPILDHLKTHDGLIERLQTVEGGGGVKIVAVKYAEFTGTQSNSTAAGANFAITGLSIYHALSNVSNSVLLFGQIGVFGDSHDYGHRGAAFTADGTKIGVGDASGARTQVGAGGISSASNAIYVGNSLFLVDIFLPGTITPKTYKLEAINTVNATRTVYINRLRSDYSPADPRGQSSLTLLELKG